MTANLFHYSQHY